MRMCYVCVPAWEYALFLPVQYVQQAEAKEGKDKVIDRKTVFK